MSTSRPQYTARNGREVPSMISFTTSTEPGTARRLRMPAGTFAPASAPAVGPAFAGLDVTGIAVPAAPKGIVPAVRAWRPPV